MSNLNDWSWKPDRLTSGAIKRGNYKLSYQVQLAKRQAEERDPFEQAIKYKFIGGNGHAHRG